MEFKKGTYKNIIELIELNDALESISDHMDPTMDKLTNYLDDYCDRDIVDRLLSDISSIHNFEFDTKAKWSQGCVDWRKQKITIL